MNIINRIKKIIKSKNNNLPKVLFSSDYIKKKLSNSCIADNSVDECLDLILSELGVKSDEQVMISDSQDFRKTENGRGYYINCYKNTKYIFKLGFKYEASFNKNPKLIVIYPYTETKEEYEIHYKSNKDEAKITLNQISYEHKYTDGTNYCRIYSPEKAKYIISKGENELVLSVESPCNQNIQEDGKGNYTKYELENEKELVSYLLELNFPITIDEVYKKICEISLGNNISNYPYIYLYATNKKNATDSIEIAYGECLKFRKTINDKTVVVNKNGHWEYKLNDKNLSDDFEEATVKFSMSYGTNGFSYNVKAKTDGELDDYTATLVTYDISTARKEVENTKKLVRKMIPQQEKNN